MKGIGTERDTLELSCPLSLTVLGPNTIVVHCMTFADTATLVHSLSMVGPMATEWKVDQHDSW